VSDDIVDLAAITDEFYGHEYDAVEELAFERAEVARLTTEYDAAHGALVKIVEAKLLCEAENVRLREAMQWAMDGNPWREHFTALLDDPSPDSPAERIVTYTVDSPADKPCETCANYRYLHTEQGSIDGGGYSVPCPSCRGGEPT
jgi:hypothetical protein